MHFIWYIKYDKYIIRHVWCYRWCDILWYEIYDIRYEICMRNDKCEKIWYTGCMIVYDISMRSMVYDYTCVI